MSINDINIASRATLSSDLNKIYENFCKNFKQTWDFYSDYIEKVDNKYKHFIDGTVLSGMFSALEILLNDSTVRYLISYPESLNKKKSIDLNIFSENYTISLITRSLAEKQIHESSYKKINDYLKDIYSFWNSKHEFQDGLEVIIEGKATRNLFTHNDRKVNSLYFQHTGEYAKWEHGQNINLDSSYLEEIKNAIEKLTNHFKEQCIDKFFQNTRISIFKSMYEKSSLNSIVAFKEIWIDENGRLYKNNDFSWAWSGSEEMLFKFFEYIFSGSGSELQDQTSCIPRALERWKGTDNERIILSWLEYPFHI